MHLIVSLLFNWLVFTPVHESIQDHRTFAGNCSRASDSTILANFCINSNGANWVTKWNIFRPMNEWSGVILNANGCVQSLILINNNVSGVIPPSFGMLSSLRVVYIFGNDLYGEIPPELGNLSQLEDLVLEDNSLSGSIPIQIAQCVQLKNMSLANNQLTGSIPFELGGLQQLVTLNLSKNQLSGSIPSSLGNMGALAVLDLSANQLVGQVPVQLSQLTDIQEFYLQDNNFSGPLPEGFSNFNQINHFWVYNNHFSGRVPDMTDAPLFSLRIENNHFNSIPNYKLVTTWGNSFPFGLVITHNDFTFEDLIPLNNFSRRYYYAFDPQNPVRLDSILFIEEGSTHVVQTLVDQSLTENNYKWYKDTSVVFISNQNTYEIIQATENDEGYYSGRITNPEISNFEIEIAPFRVIVFNPSNCDKPIAGNSCKDALHFCSTSSLHNYCGSLGVADTSLHYYLCDTQVSVNNPRWISFVAPKDSIEFEVIPINCSGVEENGIVYRGMQMALWSTCGTTSDSILVCKSECQEGPVIFGYGHFIVGNTYRLVLNGCHGDNCSYLVRVRNGRSSFDLAEPGSIHGPQLLCAGFGEQVFSIASIPGANAYLWYLQDTLVKQSPDSFVVFQDLPTGNFSLKVRAINACDTTAFSLKLFVVNPILQIQNVFVNRFASDSAFIIQFTVSGGIQPYTVSKGRGKLDSLNGSFVSDALLCKSGYEFEIKDKNGCAIVFKGFENCGCTSQAGNMPLDTLQICEGQSFTAKITGNETIDSMDLSTYVILSDIINPTGSIIKSNPNGIFPFDPVRFKFNTWYYVARVIGRRNTKGEINLNHPCLSISNLQPLIFRSKPLISAGPDIEICGREVNLNGFGNFVSSTWKIISGPGSGRFENFMDPLSKFIADSFGMYTLSFEATNGYCLSKDEVRIVFREGLKPVPTGFYFICAGQSTELDAGNYHQFKWSTGDTTRIVKLTQTGTYCISVSDINQCTGTYCFDIEEGTAPNASLVAPDTICSGRKDTVRLTEAYLSYLWNDQSTLEYLPIDTGGRYCVIVTGTNGCKDTICTDIIALKRSFELVNDTVCFGEPYIFRNKSFDTPGNYQLVIEGAAINGCDSVFNIQMNWWPKIIVQDTIILKDNGSGTGAIIVTIAGGKGSYRYLWSNGARTPGITNLRSGKYTLFVNDSEDCLQVFEFNVPMATADKDLERFKTLTKQIVVYPNPTKAEDGFHIRSLSTAGTFHLRLYNSMGTCLDKLTFVSNGVNDLLEYKPNVKPGWYCLLINEELGGFKKFELIIE